LTGYSLSIVELQLLLRLWLPQSLVLPYQVNLSLMAGTTSHVVQRAVLSADSSIPAIGDGLQNEQAWKDALVLYKANPKVPPAAQQPSEEGQM
jgi:hypothetical protein